jgi:hypothetical protein
VTDDYFASPQPPGNGPYPPPGTPYPGDPGRQHPGWVPPQAANGPPAPSGEINAMAIVSLALAFMGFGPIAAIVGHIARNRIRDRRERGDGIALAGVVIGWITTGLYVLSCGFVGLMAASGPM